VKTFRIAIAASLAALAVTSIHAEEYQGVLQFQSTLTRSEVQAQAFQAARTVNPYAYAASSVVAAMPTSPRDRATVQAEAIAHAHRPNQNLRVEAFAASQVPSYYNIDRSRLVRRAQAGESNPLR
jgi:hypothetical protein